MSGLMRYSPYRDLVRMRRMLDRIMDMFDEPLMGPVVRDPFAPFESLAAGQDIFAGDNLALDLYEQDDALVVKAALPGFNKDDIEVSERDGYLTIRARSQSEDERRADGWYIRERRAGAYQRTVRLPVEVNIDKARAELVDGVLTVSLPKADASQKGTRRIKINLPKFRLPGRSKKEGEIKISRN